MRYILLVMFLASSSFAEYAPGQLDFLIDEHLIVEGVTGSLMPLGKSTVLGEPIAAALSLSAAGKRMIERKCAEARESGLTTISVYFSNPFSGHPHDPYLSGEQASKCFYESEITPLFDEGKVTGFSVKVRRYSYYWPLELEEW